MHSLSESQQFIYQASFSEKVFLQGPAGSGKTTAGVARLSRMIAAGIPAGEILVLVPQRTLGGPYHEVIRSPDLAPGGLAEVFTLGGLARKAIELFWPIVAEQAGFRHPDLPPTFLNIETAQYHMARIVHPLIEQEGFFEGIALDRNRLYSQILDNLNKAAFIGFPHKEIGPRLTAASLDPVRQGRVYENAQVCANRFREYCLNNNLLDFSLVLEVFSKRLWPDPVVYEYLTSRYRHLIYDNVEEDTPVMHDVILDWLPDFESALVIFDAEAGYRRFLGADPGSGLRLRGLCPVHVDFRESFVNSDEIETIREHVGWAMGQADRPERPFTGEGLVYESRRFYTEMLVWVSQEIERLVHQEDVSPGEIVVLAPYLSDALRFALMNRLEAAGVPVQSHRPSRALREEPASQCLLTLAALAHPGWGLSPAAFDVAYALRQAITGLDLIRAQLLTEVLYRPGQENSSLLPFFQVKPEMQERISYVLGEQYEVLRGWLEDYMSDPVDAPDIFFSRLFGEVLSQPGFGFHGDYDSGKTASNLIDSAREFRWVVGPQLLADGVETGAAFLRMVQEGVLASQYIRSWELQAADAVLLAPAYTFLMNNRPVDIQFWLNINSKGWSERLYQPLTHPYVLSRNWPEDKVWTDQNEVATNEQTMYAVVNGLLRRCRTRVYLGLSEMDEHGFEQKGPLLNVIQKVLRSRAKV